MSKNNDKFNVIQLDIPLIMKQAHQYLMNQTGEPIEYIEDEYGIKYVDLDKMEQLTMQCIRLTAAITVKKLEESRDKNIKPNSPFTNTLQ